METAIVLLGSGLFAAAAFSDLRTRRIPNALALAVAALGLLRLVVAGDPGAAAWSLAAAAAVFVAGFALFWWGLLGGGDVKLTTAAALLVGYHGLSGFLLVMGVCGALLALAVLAIAKWAPRPAALPAAEEPHATPPRATVPYGVAIAAAGILILVLQSSIPG